VDKFSLKKELDGNRNDKRRPGGIDLLIDTKIRIKFLYFESMDDGYFNSNIEILTNKDDDINTKQVNGKLY
jgi:hypothetical protein